jgi:poly-gamma-glutamate synthesis protein (capsule biosynthesis protein)
MLFGEESSSGISSVEILSAGDIFPSQRIIDGGFQTNGGRDFSYSYQSIKPIIEKADIATAWFGGPIAEEGSTNFSGYPRYNNPPEYPLAAKDAGFDILLHTNHLFDQGLDGFLRTIRFFKKMNLPYLGIYETEEESKTVFILEKNNIKIAFLSYLYGVNEEAPRKDWMVNLIDLKKIKNDIEQSKQKGADFTIVFFHWGTEYQRYPDKEQRKAAKKIASFGADLIVGSHPHVIQPAEMLETTNSSGQTNKVFIIYSMGNFLSSQRNRYSDCGLLLRYQIEKNAGKTYLKSIGYIPTWVMWHNNEKTGQWKAVILPIKETLDLLKTKKELFLTKEDAQNIKTAWDDTTEHLDNPGIPFLHE